MKKGQSLELTKDAILKEGIEIKVTQSDVIDALVEEQINSITSIGETIINTGKELSNLISKEWDDFVEKLIEKQKMPKDLKFIHKNMSGTTCHEMNTMYSLSEYVDSRSPGTIKYSSGSKNISLNLEGKLNVKYQGKFHGIIMEGYGEPIPFKFCHSKKVATLIEQQNKKVKEFIEMVPAKGINEKEIARKIKNQFTKEILKSSSPEFRAKLKEGFGLTL